jgi:flavodoxin I
LQPFKTELKNTKIIEMAESIEEGIRSEGKDLDVKEAMNAAAADLENYDALLLEAYTWGDGEFPDEFLDFFAEMDDIDLTGKKTAVFGSCDSAYPEFGAAVDILIEKLKQLGADVVLPGLKVALSPSNDDKATCEQFGKDFAKKL